MSKTIGELTTDECIDMTIDILASIRTMRENVESGMALGAIEEAELNIDKCICALRRYKAIVDSGL